MAAYGKLPNLKRYITTHDDKGKAMISEFESDAPWQTNIEGGRAAFSQLYVTNEYPVDFNKDKDLKAYEGYLEKPPGIVVNSGTVLRIVVSCEAYQHSSGQGLIQMISGHGPRRQIANAQNRFARLRCGADRRGGIGARQWRDAGIEAGRCLCSAGNDPCLE